MSDLYFKQKCEHELNDTLCDTKCEAYIGGEGWYLVLADGDLLTRAEWEASIESIVTVNPNNDNTFGWMEHVKGPSIETTATMLGSGRYGLVKLNIEEDS